MSITDHLALVQEKIATAAKKAGRATDAIQLLAVTKTHPLETLEEALGCGLREFGESKIQEARFKVDRFGSRVRWHLIGHLQKNKVKEAVRLFDCFDAVDSLDLAEEINRRADEIGKTFPLLLQVNVSGESTKFGVSPADAACVAEAINALPRIELRGLMTMAPYTDEVEKTRPVFAGLRECRDQIEQSTGLKLPDLSMGMSNDFEIAIEEGSTSVRLGTILFGVRKASKIRPLSTPDDL
jgi:PLP dependent protein